MINYLKDCDKSTPIGMIPDIINHNNQAVNDEFAEIYDISMNRLIKSVYSPAGSVKTHKGEFVNLFCDYITIKNADSLSTYIQEAVDDISIADISLHNILNGRFSDSTITDSSYCHDAASIIYENGQTVFDVLNNIDNGNMTIKYGDETYTAAEIAQLIDWKNHLEVKTITITDENGNNKTYNVLCEQ